MAKLMLMSVIIMMIVLPIRAARIAHAGKAMRRALFSFFLYNCFYWLMIIVLYFDLYLGKSPAELLATTVHD